MSNKGDVPLSTFHSSVTSVQLIEKSDLLSIALNLEIESGRIHSASLCFSDLGQSPKESIILYPDDIKALKRLLNHLEF